MRTLKLITAFFMTTGWMVSLIAYMRYNNCIHFGIASISFALMLIALRLEEK